MAIELTRILNTSPCFDDEDLKIKVPHVSACYQEIGVFLKQLSSLCICSTIEPLRFFCSSLQILQGNSCMEETNFLKRVAPAIHHLRYKSQQEDASFVDYFLLLRTYLRVVTDFCSCFKKIMIILLAFSLQDLHLYPLGHFLYLGPSA